MQLAINFGRKSTDTERKIGDFNKNPVFHKESSTILKDRFSMKLSYLGRSYHIVWNYWVLQLKSFYDPSNTSKKISYVNIDRVEHFQNWYYVKVWLTSNQELKFQKIITNILSNIYYNPNLSNN